MANSSKAARSTKWNPAPACKFRKAILVAFCAATFAVSAVWAQEKDEVKTAAPAVMQAVSPDGKPVVMKSGPAGARPAAQPGAKPGETKPGDAKPGEQKPADQKAAPATVTQRPAKPEKAANPDELKVRPDADGKVRFNFTGQPWPAVLEWLATISHMSLDWQELPGDYLNLTTRQAYTVEEARDLINRHLFARGFTITSNGEVLSVMNLKTLDPGRVPRVSPQELAQRQPYDFVKVLFPLQWLMAEPTAEELKPMISPNGKITPLKGTNRLEIMDAVINLREINNLLKEEQSPNGQERLVREFQLQYAHAADVVDQLSELIGVEKKANTAPKTPQQLQMEQQQAMMRMQQQQQQQQQQGGQPKPPGAKEEPVNLVANSRKNSVLVNAPADKMAIIDRAIQLMDVPSSGAESLIANLNRMQVYRLGELDPEPFVKTLTELGLLDPTTRLEVDKRNKSIVAYAPLADHMVIRQLIKQLDRTGRTFEVLPLHRLEADQVAGTVEFMINGGAKDEQQQRRPYYYGFGYYTQNQEEQKSNDKFRVDADVENNRLVLWANPVEYEEVRKLLEKLGEVFPTRGANTSTVRVLNIEPGEDSAAALERMRSMWPKLSPNPLVMPEIDLPNRSSGRPDENGEKRNTNNTGPNEEARGGKAGGQSPAVRRAAPIDRQRAPAPAKHDNDSIETAAVSAVPAVLHKAIAIADDSDEGLPEVPPGNAASDAEASSSDGTSSIQAPAAKDGNWREQAGPLSGGPRSLQRGPAPVNVSIGPGGQLIVTSPDTQALDLFEEMVDQVAPPRREYKVFYLKHASAFNVALNLEDYFQLDKKKKDNNRRPYYYWDDFGSQSSKDESRRLSKRRELTFISDVDTNSILVTGADASQLKVIEELVTIYDRVEPPDSRMARMTKVFTLRYSKAKVVGEAVKDVYRDLLSTNDKALQQGDQNQKNNKRAENVYIFGSDEPEDPRGTQVKFKGKLSVGIDDLSNTLVVSTEGENLMNNVALMIESLDAAAKPALTRVEVMQVRSSLTPEMRKALSRALAEQRTQAQVPAGQQAGPNGQQPPNGQAQGQGQPAQQNGQNGQEQ